MAQPAPAMTASREADARTTAAIKAHAAAGRAEEARELFGELVVRHQRRASRIALHYLRDAAESDEAVQDAFVRAFLHFDGFREELPFEVWFTRILINGCLDRIKARSRRERWFPARAAQDREGRDLSEMTASSRPSPEATLLGREQRRRVAKALGRLPARQRLVFVLSEVEGCSSREVGQLTGLNESTVRVHLFRAVRRLRRLLHEPAETGDEP